MNASDSELLERFVREGAEGAFTELVQRHVNLVYSAALRQVAGDPGSAEDVTQLVFTDLARKARKLTQHPTLTGWLYSSTRLAANQYRRAESRRLARESAAHAMSHLLASAGSEPDWNSLRPLIDEAMHDLSEPDREAVLLRFFEQRPLAQVGERLGLSENAARMRVDRALDKLQVALAKRGITSSVAALGPILATHAVGTAPVGLVSRIAPAILEVVGNSAMSTLPGKLVLMVLSLILGIGGLMWANRNVWNRTTRDSLGTAQASVGTSSVRTSLLATEGDPTHSESIGSPAKPVAANSNHELLLQITFLARESGRPVPRVRVNYRGWEGSNLTTRIIDCDVNGEALVRIASGTTQLELISVSDGFADTKLRWAPLRGDKIPGEYTVWLERAPLIGGTVVNPSGQPLAGSKVNWGYDGYGLDLTERESFEFDSIEVETDDLGRWQVSRIAESMLARIRGRATHSEFQPSEVAGDWPVQHVLIKDLRAQTHVFRLKSAGVLRGVVVNEVGEPIPGARVLAGPSSSVGSREGMTGSDGTFEIPGVGLGPLPVTAEAKGYASRTVEATLTPQSAPIRLVLGSGKLLRLRLVNQEGDSVPQAHISLVTLEPFPLSFKSRSDDEGRVEWTEAPPGIHHFNIEASGYLRTNQVPVPADGIEHLVTLSSALVIQGRVTDADTGEPLPQFSLKLGWPSYYSVLQQTNAQFSANDRFSLSFTGGSYRHIIEERVFEYEPQCLIRFAAEGYRPQVSRSLSYDEGLVIVDAALEKETVIEVTVVDSARRPASGAQAAEVSQGAGPLLGTGRLTPMPGSDPSSIKEADAAGTIRLTIDDPQSSVVFVHRNGYFETNSPSLETNSIVQLQPWGGIEGQFLGAPEVSADQRVVVTPAERVTGKWQYSLHARSDRTGKFQFYMVPPGSVRVGHLVDSDPGNGTTSTTEGQSVEATVVPGERVQVILGGGYRVKGRLKLPAEFKTPPAAHWAGMLHPPLPLPPPEIRGDSAAVQQWLQTPDIQKMMNRAWSLPVALRPDLSFTVDNVPAGGYQLTLSLLLPRTAAQSAGPLLTANIEVVVPAEPATGEIDIGYLLASAPPEAP